jgi:hypothetical protein
MKHYEVYARLILDKHIEVDAHNEDEACEIADDKLNRMYADVRDVEITDVREVTQ